MVESALEGVEKRGDEVAAAVLVGGQEKLPASGPPVYGRFRVISAPDPRTGLDDAIRELRPDAILDLSDEPVLDYRRRFDLIAVALFRGVRYEGADFRLDPPPLPRLCAAPSIAIVGTGKRTGKTAVSAFAARTLAARGDRPVVVAMGRGGPEEPEVLRGDEITLRPADLLALADAGKHAASDYIEDALLARVRTVGCRRCGGGLAGAVGVSNVARGVEIANRLAASILLLEGSGSALPPVAADVTGLVVPASIPSEYLDGYLGPYRLLLADFVVITMAEEPFASPSQVSSITARVRTAWRPAGAEDVGGRRVIRTVFRPSPTRPIEGAAVFVATTASEAAGDAIKEHLERVHGCRVVGISHSLSDRTRLEGDLSGVESSRVNVLLCEIKAAGIDTATRYALERGLEVVYMDNVPHGIDGDDVTAAVEWAAGEAARRYQLESGD